MYIYYMYVHKYEVHVSIVQILQREIHYYEHTTQYNVTQQPSPPPQFGPSLLLKKGGGLFSYTCIVGIKIHSPILCLHRREPKGLQISTSS